MVPQVITDCRNFTLEHLQLWAFPLFLRVPQEIQKVTFIWKEDFRALRNWPVLFLLSPDMMFLSLSRPKQWLDIRNVTTEVPFLKTCMWSLFISWHQPQPIPWKAFPNSCQSFYKLVTCIPFPATLLHQVNFPLICFHIAFCEQPSLEGSPSGNCHVSGLR